MDDWFDIHPSFKLSKYKITKDGRVKNKAEQILKTNVRSGFPSHSLTDDDEKSNSYCVHRLVGFTFLPIVDGKDCIRHKDGNNENNFVENLEFATKSECAFKSKPRGGKQLSRRVFEFDVEMKLLKEWDCVKDATEFYGASRDTISHACCIPGKKYKGHYWKYAEEEKIDGEEWKDLEIDGTIITISSHGRMKFADGTISYGSTDTDGYQRMAKNRKGYRAHILVCMAFKPEGKTENKIYVNHIDGCKSNNCVENLEWCSQSENTKHAVDTLKKIGKPVLCYDKDGDFLAEFHSISAAAAKYDIHPDGISNVCSGKQASTKGMIFKFKV